MRTKATNAVAKAKNFSLKYGPMATAIVLNGCYIISNVVSATSGGTGGGGGNATGLAETILGIVAKLIIALGVFIAAMGVVNFASAHAEGNGGSQSQAVKQIAAGVMVVALSVILDNQKGTLAGYITS